MTIQKIIVPNIGDFQNVEIIEVLVKEGSDIKKNDSIITVESDKSSVEVPSTFDGTVEKINVKIGDQVNQGDLILTVKSKNPIQTKEIFKEEIKETINPTQKKEVFKPTKIDPKYIGKKMSRNEPCLCGSGIKYKKCCGAL